MSRIGEEISSSLFHMPSWSYYYLEESEPNLTMTPLVMVSVWLWCIWYFTAIHPWKVAKFTCLSENVLTSLCNVFFFFLWHITRVYGVLGSYVSLCIDAVLSYFMYLLKYQLFPDGVLFVCLCFIYSYHFLFACIVTGCTKGRNI